MKIRIKWKWKGGCEKTRQRDEIKGKANNKKKKIIDLKSREKKLKLEKQGEEYAVSRTICTPSKKKKKLM